MIGTFVLHHAWKNNVKNVVATSAGVVILNLLQYHLMKMTIGMAFSKRKRSLLSSKKNAYSVSCLLEATYFSN